MRRIVLWGLLLIAGLVVYVQAQGGGRGRGGGGMGGMGFDADWMMICFELKVEGEQLDNLRKAYQEAWDARKLLLEDMAAGGFDRQLMREEMQQIQANLKAALGKELTAEQLEQLEKLRQQRRQAWQGGRGGG